MDFISSCIAKRNIQEVPFSSGYEPCLAQALNPLLAPAFKSPVGRIGSRQSGASHRTRSRQSGAEVPVRAPKSQLGQEVAGQAHQKSPGRRGSPRQGKEVAG